MSKPKRSLPQNQSPARWLGLTAKAGRSALEVVLGIKTKNPMYIGLGVASLLETIEDYKSAELQSIAERMTIIGMKPVFTQVQLCRFLLQTMKYMSVPSFPVDLGKADKGQGGNDLVTGFDLGSTTAYVHQRYSWIEAIYSTTAQDLLDAFAAFLDDRLGPYVALAVDREDFGTATSLVQYKPNADAYVPPIDIEEFCRSVEIVQRRGLNRASLLFGPPGTGKTTFAAEIARHLNGRFLLIEAASLNRIMETGLQFSKLIDMVLPRVVLFDDMDRVERLDDLYGEVERLNRTRSRREILILASVNHLKALPEPLRRPGRFDEIIEFHPPHETLRRSILESHLQHLGAQQQVTDDLVQWTEGMSGAELREVALQIDLRGCEGIRNRIEHMKRIKNPEDPKAPDAPPAPKA